MIQITRQECQLFQSALQTKISQFEKMAEAEMQTKGITKNYKLFIGKVHEWKELSQDLFRRM